MTRRWKLFGALLFLPLLAACKKDEDASASGPAFTGAWTCEEHWLVSGTVKDIGGMITLAGGKSAGDKAVPQKQAREYAVGSVKVTMAPSCWDTASYKPLFAASGLSAKPHPDAAPDLLRDLLTPTAIVIQKANDTISERLKAAPADPLVHEEAAFLIGIFGMRENSRMFFDTRQSVSRITAHLAFADHLRAGGQPSLVGNWARVFHHYLAGRARVARDLAAAIPSEGDSAHWKRVIGLLITGDWRGNGDLEESSLAEAIAHARALKEHRGNPAMIEFVGAHKELQESPEWMRLLSGRGASVEEGHQTMEAGLTVEIMEVSQVFSLGEEGSPEQLAGVLSPESPAALVDGKGSPRVIADGDWAAYFRRHFFASCTDTAWFTMREWASMEGAVSWEKAVLPYCKALPGHELVEPFLATNGTTYGSRHQAAVKYVLAFPEKTNSCVWRDLEVATLQDVSGLPMPDQIPWFREVSPPGTAYIPERRVGFKGIDVDYDNKIKMLHEINPWDTELCWRLSYINGTTPEALKKAWGEMREYSAVALRQTLNSPSANMDDRIESLEHMAAFDVGENLRLGEALVLAGRTEEAAKAYKKAFDDAPDRVRVSNTTQWLIYYYLNRGWDKKAREVADHNEEVFSARGLSSALALALVEEDAPRARKIAEAIAERYGDRSYLEVAAWDGGKNQQLLDSVFPGGIKTVTLADFDLAQTYKGTRIVENSLPVKAAGLRAGDVILAVDGKRVESYRQYFLLMASGLEPNVKMIYRRGKKIIAEADCRLPSRRLESSMKDIN